MKVRGTVLDTPQGESLYRSIPRLIQETFELQVMHLMIQKCGKLMATRTLSLPEEEFLSAHFLFRGFGRIKSAVTFEFWRRRKIEHVLKLRHMTYMNPVKYGKAFFHCTNRIAIEISGTEFELCEVFH